jgi:hypothetical protein
MGTASSSHGDGSGGDFGEAGDDNDMRGGVGARQSGRQGEWNSQTVRHSNDNVPNEFRSSEMLLNVRR